MAVQRGVLGPLIFLAMSCSHEPAADPTLGELQGEWTMRDGRIRFVPQGSTYHFEGRVTADEMNGTMSANPFYPDAGIQVETAGSWRAARELIP